MNTYNLISVILFQKYRRATLSRRSLYFRINCNFILIFSFNFFFDFIKHFNLRKLFFYVFFLFCWITNYSKLKFHLIIQKLLPNLKHREKTVFPKKRLEVSIDIFSFQFLIIFYEIVDEMIMIFINSNQSNIIATLKIMTPIFIFTMNKKILFINFQN